MRISDWSSDVCSSDLFGQRQLSKEFVAADYVRDADEFSKLFTNGEPKDLDGGFHENLKCILRTPTISRNLDASEVDGFVIIVQSLRQDLFWRSEEHTSSLQYLMCISSDIFHLKK